LGTKSDGEKKSKTPGGKNMGVWLWVESGSHFCKNSPKKHTTGGGIRIFFTVAKEIYERLAETIGPEKASMHSMIGG